MSSTSSSKGNNYYQLFDAFNETHEEANRLALSLNWLKGLITGWKTKSSLLKNS